MGFHANYVGEQILTALDDVAQSAERALAQGPSGVSSPRYQLK
jgi:hypothetical protein